MSTFIIRMAKNLIVGHEVVEDACQSLSDLDTDVACLDAGLLPGLRQLLEVGVTADETIRSPQQRRPPRAIAAAQDRPAPSVYFTTLITGGPQPCSAGDGGGRRVVLDRSQLGSEVRRADDVQPRTGQQSHVPRATQQTCQLLFKLPNLLLFLLVVFLQSQRDALVRPRRDIGRGGLPCPVQEGSETAPVEVDALVLEHLAQAS